VNSTKGTLEFSVESEDAAVVSYEPVAVTARKQSNDWSVDGENLCGSVNWMNFFWDNRSVRWTPSTNDELEWSLTSVVSAPVVLRTTITRRGVALKGVGVTWLSVGLEDSNVLNTIRVEWTHKVKEENVPRLEATGDILNGSSSLDESVVHVRRIG